MEGNNWRPAASQWEPAVDSASEDWRSQLHPDARQRIVNKIMETLKRYAPIYVSEGISEHKKIAVRFEEKIYTAATNESDYLRRISVKILSMEPKAQGTVATNSSPSNLGVTNSNSADSVAPGSNYFSVRTPSAPTNKSLDVAIPPLPRDQPLDRRCKWGAVASKTLCYVFNDMAEDSILQGNEIDRLSRAEEQALKDLDAAKAETVHAKEEGRKVQAHREIGERAERREGGTKRKGGRAQGLPVTPSQRDAGPLYMARRGEEGKGGPGGGEKGSAGPNRPVEKK